MTSDHVSATKIYVMGREEHLWVVSVLQGARISTVTCLELQMLTTFIAFSKMSIYHF
jgi:hypothetical protein